MSHSQNDPTLDLHGRRLEEAISEVTSFLDRLRRSAAASSGRPGVQNFLFVQIITGSGSHSTHGPILRSAVQKLLDKRGMTYRLIQGGGAFQVDALSGVDLYAPALAADSKVVVTEQDEFHQLASSRRSNNAPGASMAQCASNSGRGAPRTVTVPIPMSSFHSSSSDPLPAQVASADEKLRTATELSIVESQKHRNDQECMDNEFERQLDRAVSESHLEQMAAPKRIEEEKEEEQFQLKLAFEESLIDEQYRQQLTEDDYEKTIMLAMEESATEANRQKASEDDFIQQALAESMAEAEKANNDEDALLEKALAESLLEEETLKYHHEKQEALDTSNGGVDILGEIMRLSLKNEEEDRLQEEEALREIMERSKHIR